MADKVSVIIPVYNCEVYLERCINSILGQTYQNFEIIICDDCSTDTSYQLALELQKRDDRIKIKQNTENKRAAATRNECIKVASGDYIFIQDADDYVDKSILEKEIQVLKQEKDIAFVSSGMYRFNDKEIWGKYLSKEEYPTNRNFLWCLPFVHSGTMIRKEAIDKIGGYRIDKRTKRMEDFDLFVRLYANELRGKNLMEYLYYYNEDDQCYKRRKYQYRIDEAIIRYQAYKKLKLMPIGLLYTIKPLVVGLLPRKVQYALKKNWKKVLRSN